MVTSFWCTTGIITLRMKDATREAEPWILTYSGIAFDLLNPRPEDVRVEDIAHHLSLLCRFTGAVRSHYSVAQHSVMVADMLPEPLRLAGLLHDAHEAYLGDWSSPLKTAMKKLAANPDALATRVDLAIGEKFGVEVLVSPEIRHADLVALATEMRDLLPHHHKVLASLPEPAERKIVPWPAKRAEAAFLAAFRNYTR